MQRQHILVCVNHTLRVAASSGIQRVVGKIAAHLPEFAEVSFVTWDYSAGQLRYLDARGLDRLCGKGDWPAGVVASPYAHRVNFRFGDTLPAGRPVWLLFPEVSYHAKHGTEVMARIISMCRGYGVLTAAIFYDLIPLRHPQYQDLAARHASYVAQLVRCDRLFAISRFERRSLIDHFARALEEVAAARLESLVTAVPLGESDYGHALLLGANGEARNGIFLLGTVEPRKGQLRVIESFNSLPSEVREGFELDIAGSLHPDVAAKFERLVAVSGRVRYHGYVNATQARALFARARFSIFASEDEGFGLPIAESLTSGVPCLTANFGAMAEVACGGGCATVDVRSERELSQAMVRLMQDDALIASLRKEIADRPLRTWREYAAALANETRMASDAEVVLERCRLEDVTGKLSDTRGRGKVVSVAFDASEFRMLVADECPSRACLEKAARSSVCIVTSSEARDALISKTAANGVRLALPDILVAEPVQGAAPEVARLVADRVRWQEVADRELMLRRVVHERPDASNLALPKLCLVISTYNRARFLEENVRWLLRLLSECPSDIRLMVVDNASTDDTLERLARFEGHARLTVISNPVNVGMLGNLRVCSSLVQARHVWIIGDDDFVTPKGLAVLLEALNGHPELPFVFVNFGIYRRLALGERDAAHGLIAERIPLAAEPVPSGLYPIRQISEQHDNLFTAFYPIVFRSDLLATCFDYPFDGKPFVDLVEAVPTTKMILETYAETEAYWCAPIGIVGNIANSWSAHLPRWHAVLMPRVFQLARRVGVDPSKLWAWAQLHKQLFREAEQTATNRGESLDVALHELEVAHHVFQKPLELKA